MPRGTEWALLREQALETRDLAALKVSGLVEGFGLSGGATKCWRGTRERHWSRWRKGRSTQVLPLVQPRATTVFHLLPTYSMR